MKSDTLDRRGGWFDHPVLSLLRHFPEEAAP
jgi:hypothetical protein